MKKINRKDDSDDSNLKSFEDELTLKSAEKLLLGPLRTYKLQGHPANLLKYIARSIDNAALSIVQRHHNEVIKNTMGMSSRTLRRWESELKEGKMQPLSSGDRPKNIKDLGFYNIGKIQEQKLLNQKHTKEGYFSQRELIRHLSSHTFQKIFLKTYKQEFPGYSEATLRNKIKSLLDENLIKAEETGNSRLFKRDDIITIAQAILNLRSKK